MAFLPHTVKVYYCIACDKRLACWWGKQPVLCKDCRWSYCPAEEVGYPQPVFLTCPRCQRVIH